MKKYKDCKTCLKWLDGLGECLEVENCNGGNLYVERLAVLIKDKYINELINDELKNANKKFQQFSSNHEAISVIREEIEEVDAEFKLMSNYYNIIWNDIKKNRSNNILGRVVDDLEIRTILAIKELIQVAAMCRKFKTLLGAANEK